MQVRKPDDKLQLQMQLLGEDDINVASLQKNFTNIEIKIGLFEKGVRDHVQTNYLIEEELEQIRNEESNKFEIYPIIKKSDQNLYIDKAFKKQQRKTSKSKRISLDKCDNESNSSLGFIEQQNNKERLKISDSNKKNSLLSINNPEKRKLLGRKYNSSSYNSHNNAVHQQDRQESKLENQLEIELSRRRKRSTPVRTTQDQNQLRKQIKDQYLRENIHQKRIRFGILKETTLTISQNNQAFSSQIIEIPQVQSQKNQIVKSKMRDQQKMECLSAYFPYSDLHKQIKQLKYQIVSMLQNNILKNYPLRMRLLLYTCIQCPYSIAFLDPTDHDWRIINAIVDSIFLMDIIINFISPFYDKEFELVDDQSVIAKKYLCSWFPIDFLSIIPFDLLYETSGFNRMSRVIRIGKIYKIVKMTRMVRMLKIVKERSRFVKYLNQALQIGIGFERLIYLLLMFLVMCHVTACLWIFVAKYEASGKNWITQNGYEGDDNYTIYITSFYFTVTTIVTVGYGDIHAYSIGEKYMSIILMIIGVISFSFATGALSNIISNYDASQAHLKEKMATLNDIRTKYEIDPELFDELRKTVKYDHSKNYHDVTKFMKELPYKLKIELALEIHKGIYREIEFFKKQDKNFIVWVCPLLRPFLVSEQDYIFKEGDDIKEIYFLEKGVAGYVLPRFDNTIYIQVDKGDHFGELDLVYDPMILDDQINIKKKTQKNKDIFRRFSIQAVINCELLILTIDDIDKMKLEFPEVFDDLFNNSIKRLEKVHKLKMDAIEQCDKISLNQSSRSSGSRFSVFSRLQLAMTKDISRKSDYIQQYKNERYKKNLTISDVNQIAKFSENKASLKQIDEEIESSDSSESKSQSSNDLENEETKSLKDSESSSEEIKSKRELLKNSKKFRKSQTEDSYNKSKIERFQDHQSSRYNKTYEESSDSSTTNQDFKTIVDKRAVLKAKKRFSNIFSKRHKMSFSLHQSNTFRQEMEQQKRNAKKINQRVDGMKVMMSKMMKEIYRISDTVLQIKDRLPP
ncbi:cation channel family protein [Stylonychia lemnae]|uniref:Cation channel family protein n=1 Tax=Stylonychia lemnae TaxID=5949 RepID=A0A078B688_STYLE|nr:cation channel family protein [Stylonychia lemnae]|eukprot:CDW88827.1 cation channel family protein [Stylonychia lemnae]